MTATRKIIMYELRDIVRSRWILFYALFFLVITEGLFRFGGGSANALVSLSSLALVIVPLISIVFGAMYLYDARSFTELLLTQPVGRVALFRGLYIGLALPIAMSFLLGIGIPLVFRGILATAHLETALVLAVSGTLLTFIFVALAFLVAVTVEQKVRGLSVSILLWLLLTVLYDGLVLALAAFFADYPLERPMLVLMLLNPVDLARVLLLLTFDLSALMGYTGAVFEQFFGTLAGKAVSIAGLMSWIVIPLVAGIRRFKKKDF